MSEVPLPKIFEVLPEEGPSGLRFHTSPQQKFTSQLNASTNCDIDNENNSLYDREEDSLDISEKEISGIYFSPSARKQDSNRKSSLYFADESQSSDRSPSPENIEKKKRRNKDCFHRSPYLLRSSSSRSSSMDNLNDIDNYLDQEENQNCQSRLRRRKTSTEEECRSCFPKEITAVEKTAKEMSFGEKKRISIQNSLPTVIENEEEPESGTRESLSSTVTTDNISLNINSKQNTFMISQDPFASATDCTSAPLKINVRILKEFSEMPVNLIITKQLVIEANECEKPKNFQLELIDDKTEENNKNEEAIQEKDEREAKSSTMEIPTEIKEIVPGILSGRSVITSLEPPKLNESNDTTLPVNNAIIRPIEEFDISKPGPSSTPNTSLVLKGTDKNNEKKGPDRKRKNNKAGSTTKTNNKVKSKKTAKNKENKCRNNDERSKSAKRGKIPAKATKQAKCNKKSRFCGNKKISHRPCRHCESSSESDSSCCSICDGYVCDSSTSCSSCTSCVCSSSSDYSSFYESN